MTQFDILVLLLLGVSAAVGFARGAVREIIALLALVFAAGLAVFGLPVFGPMVRNVIQPDWLGTVSSLILVFIVAFVALRLIGAGVSRAVQRAQGLGFLDRSFGLLIGLGRGLIVLGALFLMFNAATPEDLRPKWITDAQTWPLAANMGRVLDELAPKGLDVAGRLKPAFDRAVRDGSGDRTTTDGYDAPEPANPVHPERSR
ncbi:CvpA family protein [uncultured Phenylobacterium sp.]|uniref:CvpA family protein n=1 Tax=uncultured Phenylobacterium sp. TaxID=349273 RepID=UPI0025F7A589|nr:CvpA family protein [uncultured Phenylobacterium sp.]